MGILSHGIGFVENDDFVWGTRVLGSVGGGGVRELHACKVFDLFAHDADSTLVGGVEFQDASLNQFRAVEFFS